MEIPISQDIRKYKTKDVGGFSFKEAGFLALGAAVGILVYNLTNSNIEIAILPAGLIIIVGFIKPFGMTFTQFLKTVVAEQLTPSTYIYESDFFHDEEDLIERFGEEYDIVGFEDDTVVSSGKKDVRPQYDAERIIR